MKMLAHFGALLVLICVARSQINSQYPSSRTNTQYPSSSWNTKYPSGSWTQYPSGSWTQYPSSWSKYPSSVYTQYPGSSWSQYPSSLSTQYPSSTGGGGAGDTKYPTRSTDTPVVVTSFPTHYQSQTPADVASQTPSAGGGGGTGATCTLGEWASCHKDGCCTSGLVCYRQHKWYSQCRKPGTCPADWECGTVGTPGTPTAPPAPPVCSVPEWGGCSATRCCESGLECLKQHQWYSQCRQPGDCPAGWECSTVKQQTKGAACGCDGYRNGAVETDPVLCKLHKAGSDGKRWCEPPDTSGQCAAKSHKACGEKMRLSLLVNAAKDELLDGSLLIAMSKALKIEAKKLVMEWICPSEVCTPECPTTKQYKVLRGCIDALKSGTTGRKASLLGDNVGSWVAQFAFKEDTKPEEVSTGMDALGNLVDDIATGKPVSPDASDLKKFVTKDTKLEVSAAPVEDSPFVPKSTEAPASDGGSLSLGVIIGIVGGALTACTGIGLYVVKSRSGGRGINPDKMLQRQIDDQFANDAPESPELYRTQELATKMVSPKGGDIVDHGRI
eukprot:Hpha_TRINITY_DN16310_c0_g3::TRINITY_DN16310_c0_g3_i11::g.59087::m.59087